ncbi:hypothetical protein [Abditibacterium utsteinense]|uniref:hypothetical protein n=1 Tax=Abditibacterium utsteinense TaxID=1960156 RepID=UPI000D096891|nr:hypothetical protein [Abditibacterium utsteinense]
MSQLVFSLDEAQLRALVARGLSSSQIAVEVGCSHLSVRRALKKYGLETSSQPTFLCLKCGTTDASKFVNHKQTCRECHASQISKKHGDARAQAVAQLGGQCLHCGYDEFEVALDVHQVDPTIKDPNFAAMRGWNSKEIEKELRGCVLLCKNCHAAIHAGLLSL